MPTPQPIPRPRGLTTRDHFLSLTQRFATLVRREGLELAPFSGTQLPHFSRLSPSEQEVAIWKMHTLCAVCQILQNQGHPISDTPKLTEEYLKFVNALLPPGLMENLAPDDVVDIHTEDHQMIFATLGFFKCFTYSLEELFCRPWTELYASDTPFVRERYLELADRLLSGREKGLVKIDSVPDHVAFEILQPGRFASVAIPKFAASLFEESGRVCGYLLVHILSPLGRSI